jgi:hypothetical protein
MPVLLMITGGQAAVAHNLLKRGRVTSDPYDQTPLTKLALMRGREYDSDPVIGRMELRGPI